MDKFNEWIKEIQKKNEVKMYRHFDSRIDLNSEKDIERIKKTIQNLKTHQFLPFIKRVNNTPKYRRKNCSCGQLELGNVCDKNCRYQEKEAKRKLRPLMYASNLDSYVYSYSNHLISEFYEKKIKENDIHNTITAYRKIPTLENPLKNKCNIHFAHESFEEIKKHQSCIVITADITSFFDNLNHTLLKDNLSEILGVDKLGTSIYKVYKSLTHYKYVNYYPDFKNKKVKYFLKFKNNTLLVFLKLKEFIKKNKSNIGIPQGSPISGLFSNIYMYNFDLSFRRNFPGIFYRRYSDDILIICQKVEEEQVKNFLMSEIKDNKLRIEPSKTNISYYSNGEFIEVKDGENKNKRRNYVDYLGFEFFGDKVQMRKKSLGKLRDKQEKKVKKRVYNTSYEFKPSKNKRVQIKSTYLQKSLEIFDDKKLAKQVKSLSKRRNKTKSKTLYWKNFFKKINP